MYKCDADVNSYLCKSVHHSLAESATRNRSLKPWSLSAKTKEVATYTTAYIRITINNIQHAEFQNMFYSLFRFYQTNYFQITVNTSDD